MDLSRDTCLLLVSQGLDFADTLEEYCCPDHYVEDCDEQDVCMLFEQKHSPSKYGRIITNHAQSLSPKQYKYVFVRHCSPDW